MDILVLGIIFLRLTAPFLILRMPLLGVALCSLLDLYDFEILGVFGSYQSIDKVLDLYYLSFCLYVSLSWKDTIARTLSIGLFVYRLIGVIVLILTRQEWVLLIFPNIFEMLFLFYMLYVKIGKNTQLFTSWMSTIPVLIIITIPKMVQEYGIHYNIANPKFPLSIISWIVNSPTMIYSFMLIILPVVGVVYYAWRAKKSADTLSNLPSAHVD